MAKTGPFLKAPRLLRWFWKVDVTICIPAYEAQSFIDRTLRCAQRQTHDRIRILVSVDRSNDDTAQMCHAFAADDRRIEVIEHKERLGWAGNVNALLDRAGTSYFFIYFHDDLILPQYCAMLRAALIRRDDAASANCDLLDFGDVKRFRPGRDYQGLVAKRILTLWTVPERGTPLRSMIRRERLGAGFRLPRETDSFARGETLLVEMMTAGQAVRVPETLYRRWQRKGGMTAGWRERPLHERINAWRADLSRIFALIDEKIANPQHRTILKFAHTEFVLRGLAASCRAAGLPLPDPQELHSDAVISQLPSGIDEFGDEIANAMRKNHARLSAARGALSPA